MQNNPPVKHANSQNVHFEGGGGVRFPNAGAPHSPKLTRNLKGALNRLLSSVNWPFSGSGFPVLGGRGSVLAEHLRTTSAFDDAEVRRRLEVGGGPTQAFYALYRTLHYSLYVFCSPYTNPLVKLPEASFDPWFCQGLPKLFLKMIHFWAAFGRSSDHQASSYLKWLQGLQILYYYRL